jgi:AcrR family transcriptional regulator
VTEGKKLRLTARERRAQLLEVGRQVFAQHGYSAASIEEVARAGDVSKPVVYEHFGGKEGLYAVIVDREMSRLVERIAAEISEGSARRRFERAVLAFLTYVDEEPDGFSVLTRDGPPTTPGRGMQSVISDLAERVGDVFAEQLAAAGLKTEVAALYAHALIGMVTMVGQWWIDSGRKLDVKTVARHTAAVGWMGLRHMPQTPHFEDDPPPRSKGHRKKP